MKYPEDIKKKVMRGRVRIGKPRSESRKVEAASVNIRKCLPEPVKRR
jgi:hypothetical protein